MINFTLTQLQYAVAVARCGGFRRASDQCHVSQPTLSMQVAKLERIVGNRIFDRESRDARLTPFGDAFVKQAARIIDEAEKLASMLEVEARTAGAVVRLGVIPTVARSVVHHLAECFARRFPNARLSIREETTREVVRSLRAGTLDLGVVAVPLHEPDIDEATLYTEPFTACLPEAHPLRDSSALTIEDLPKEEILLLREGHCLRNQVLEVCGIDRAGTVDSNASRIGANVSFESGSFESLLPLVRRGFGITLVPVLTALEIRGGTDAQSGRHEDLLEPAEGLVFRRFVAPVPARRIGLACLRAHRHQVPIAEISRIVVEGVADRLAAFGELGERILDP